MWYSVAQTRWGLLKVSNTFLLECPINISNSRQAKACKTTLIWTGTVSLQRKACLCSINLALVSQQNNLMFLFSSHRNKVSWKGSHRVHRQVFQMQWHGCLCASASLEQQTNRSNICTSRRGQICNELMSNVAYISLGGTLFAFGRRRHVHSTAVRPFCRSGRMGDTWNLYILVTMWW